MTREQAKELLPVIKAFAEGKMIEGRRKFPDEQWSVTNYIDPTWFLNNNNYEYRIMPESTYRPFKSGEECWQEMQKHQPFGWVKEKERNIHTLITFLHTEGIETFHSGSTVFRAVFKDFTFADGIPFGIKEDNPNI